MSANPLPEPVSPSGENNLLTQSRSSEDAVVTQTFDGANPEISLYRERTIALLRQYFRFSIEVGRLPSILGREIFRSKITCYPMSSFEDAVIFVHDVERALDRLPLFHQQVIATVIFEDYSHEQAADVLRCARKTIVREFPMAVDCISEMFLLGGLLNRLVPAPVEKTCQEGEEGNYPLTTSRIICEYSLVKRQGYETQTIHPEGTAVYAESV